MKVRHYALFIALLLALLGVYANHFRNSFHFDDAHTIESNVHIRSLSNIPAFFLDSRTFSNLPTHQVYRPLLTTTLAIDYVRGGGHPLTFHATAFALFVLLICTVWQLYSRMTNAPSVALVATAIYALHPAIAETVNYIIQRGDLLSTLGVAAALLMYIRLPHLRRFGIYLLPLAAALLAKPPALIFPVILFAWVILFEHPGDWSRSAKAVIPSLLVCSVMGWFLSAMTTASFNPGGTSAALYRITQMYVSLYYFSAFFAPVHLSVDSDWTALSGLADPRAWVGAAFLAAVVVAIRAASKRREWRPVAFGLIWFLAALFPTSWMPLAEVANDHRMFFPFIGLTLSVVCTGWLLIGQRWQIPAFRYGTALLLCLVLTLEMRGTMLRNEVWRTEETLWRDAAEKSPRNGRALMNYALTLQSRGATNQALGYLERARQLLPNYFFLEINLGIAKSSLNRHAEAETHFQKAAALEPLRYESHFFYARWLLERGRASEATQLLRRAVDLNSYALDARHLYMQLLAADRSWSALDAAIADTLRIIPTDPDALRLRALPRTPDPEPTTPEGWLAKSLKLYQAGDFRQSIQACRKALLLRPTYAEAWNNIAAAHNSLHEWTEGIRAANEAVRLKPDFELARNNRDWAISQQRVAQQR